MMCRSVKPKRKGLLSELRSRLDTSPCIHAGVSDISAIIVPLGWRARVILSSLFLEYILEGGQNRPLFEGSRQKSGLKNKREIADIEGLSVYFVTNTPTFMKFFVHWVDAWSRAGARALASRACCVTLPCGWE